MQHSSKCPSIVYNQLIELQSYPLLLTFFRNILPFTLQILMVFYVQLSLTHGKDNLFVSTKDKISVRYFPDFQGSFI